MVCKRITFMLLAFTAMVAVVLIFDTKCKASSHLGSAGNDLACGPKCLWALTQLTKVGEIACDVRCIYRLIGKEFSSPVSLKDLRDAAERLGFRAKAYKLGVKDIKELKEYAILPMGNTAGTQDDPLHFILMAGISGEFVMVVDTEKLDLWTLPITELQKNWDGAALVISSREAGKPLSRPVFESQDFSLLSNKSKYETIDLGSHETGSTVKYSILISEQSDRSSGYQILGKSCRCTDAELNEDVEGKTHLTVQIQVKEAGLQEVRVAVASREEKIPKWYLFRVSGTDALKVTPRKGYFEAEAGLSTYPVTIKYFTVDTSASAVFKELETDIKGLTCGEVISTQTFKGGLKVFEFNVSLLYHVDENRPHSFVSEEVVFILNTSNGERSVPFELTIDSGKPTFRLTPQKLFVRCSKSATNASKKTVKLEFLSGSEIHEISFKKTDSLPIQVTSQHISGPQYEVHIAAILDKVRGMPTGLHKGDISIFFKSLSNIELITLPVVLLIHE